MQEHISLELAKEIASRYERLGVEAPISKYAYDSSGEVRFADTLATIYFDYRAYTAAEIFDALPVGTTVEKLTPEIYRCRAPQNLLYYSFTDAEILVEALALMLERVLEERRREKGK
jgi:hypothetical protein